MMSISWFRFLLFIESVADKKEKAERIKIIGGDTLI
jgi:hypothetical protein